ncbi:hypothetical protein ACFPOH_11435 [Ureibacillus suwonensis]|uniref:Uncharacterized protein n=1 Tax=Ureibacillus suwonensis TaxID=313007 RepID=A0ABW0RDE9_9BACL
MKIDNKPCFLQILSTLYIVNESLGQCHSIFGFINGRSVFGNTGVFGLANFLMGLGHLCPDSAGMLILRRLKFSFGGFSLGFGGFLHQHGGFVPKFGGFPSFMKPQSFVWRIFLELWRISSSAWRICSQIRRFSFFYEASIFRLADFSWILADFFISMADLFPDSADSLLL